MYQELIQLNSKNNNNNNNNLIEKMGKGPEQTFSPRRRTDGQEVHEKMLNITNHQGNANQNHNEVPPHTCQNGNH